MYKSISEWVDEGIYEEATATWHYVFQDEQGIRSDTEYTYLVVARDQAGNLSSSEESDPI
jgi:hypothetical protein